MVVADVGRAGHGLTGAAPGSRQGSANAGLNAAHAIGAPHRGALADLADGLAGAEITGLLQPGIGGTCDHLAGTGLVAGDVGGAPGAGAAHHLGFVGDTEAHLGGLRGRLGAAEIRKLLAAHIFIPRHQAAAAGFVPGHMLAAAHMGASDTRASQGMEAGHLVGSPATHLALVTTYVLGAGELPARARLIAGHVAGAAHHHAGNGLAPDGLAAADLAGAGIAAAAVSSRLVGRYVFSAGDVFAGAGLIAGDLFRATHLVAGDAIAMGGGADPHLGGLGSDRTALAEGLKHLSPEVLGARNGAAGRRLVTGGLGGAVCLGAGHNLATAGFADAHFPMGVSGHGLLRTVAVGAGWSGATVTTGAGTSHLGPQLPHLLGELAGAHIRVALTGEGRRRGAGGGIGGFTTLGEGFAAGQGQGSAGITLGRSLRGYPPIVALA